MTLSLLKKTFPKPACLWHASWLPGAVMGTSIPHAPTCAPTHVLGLGFTWLGWKPSTGSISCQGSPPILRHSSAAAKSASRGVITSEHGDAHPEMYTPLLLKAPLVFLSTRQLCVKIMIIHIKLSEPIVCTIPSPWGSI